MLPIWTLDNVVVNAPQRPRLHCESLQILPGVTAVVGESGAGKSTLLHLLAGFERADSGRLITGAVRSGELPLFWAPQDDGLWPHLNVRQHIEAVCPQSGDATLWLERLGLGALALRRIDQLSVGERSRLSIARAMSADAAVTLLDEPFAHVDRVRRTQYWHAVVADVRTRGRSLVYATHSPRMVLGYADRVVVMRDGRVLAEGGADALYWQPQTQQAAEALGDTNWFAPGEAGWWLPGAHDALTQCRPCELSLEASDAGDLQIEEVVAQGELQRVRLRHLVRGEQRWFCVTGSIPPAAERVVLRHSPAHEITLLSKVLMSHATVLSPPYSALKSGGRCYTFE